MRSPHVLISTSVALLFALAPELAKATPNFPDAIHQNLSLAYTPKCTICHRDNAGGRGTVIRPFGLAMVQHGLMPYDTNALSSALNALETQKIDSDCNGTPDIEQLKAGQDPNTAEYLDGSGKPTPPDPGCTAAPETPAYGCGAHIAPAPASAAWQGAFALAALLALALVRRRA